MNQELRALFEQDQADRDGGLRPDARARDDRRRRQVEALIAAGGLRDPEDYYHAAMVFQHGTKPAHYLRAHELASRGAELGVREARWLAAAAYDRWLMMNGRPQKYGTQYRADGGRWVLWEVDPATTDAERAQWDVPTLAEAHARAEEMTRTDPPPRR